MFLVHPRKNAGNYHYCFSHAFTCSSPTMNFFRTLPSKIVQVSHFKIGTTKKRQSGQNCEKSQGDRLDGRFNPLKECPLYGNDILNRSTSTTVSRHDSLKENYGRKRSRDYSDDDHLDAKRHPFEKNHSGIGILNESNRNPFSENCRRKRTRLSDESEDDDEEKKRRLNDVQYAIKHPSQYADPNRQILETLFNDNITADGWKKKNDSIEYHTEVRGKLFYEIGHSLVDAREHVAATALKNLCRFKRENIFWPDTLLPFQLNQLFADKIERSVHHSLQFPILVYYFNRHNNLQNGEKEIRSDYGKSFPLQRIQSACRNRDDHKRNVVRQC